MIAFVYVRLTKSSGCFCKTKGLKQTSVCMKNTQNGKKNNTIQHKYHIFFLKTITTTNSLEKKKKNCTKNKFLGKKLYSFLTYHNSNITQHNPTQEQQQRQQQQ